MLHPYVQINPCSAIWQHRLCIHMFKRYLKNMVKWLCVLRLQCIYSRSWDAISGILIKQRKISTFTFPSPTALLHCGHPTLPCSGKSSLLDLQPHTPHVTGIQELPVFTCGTLFWFTHWIFYFIIFFNFKLIPPYILLKDLYFFAQASWPVFPCHSQKST